MVLWHKQITLLINFLVKLKVDKLINTHYINNVKAHGGKLMKRNYPEFLLEEFGNDLQDIFGSVEEQENKIHEQENIINHQKKQINEKDEMIRVLKYNLNKLYNRKI